MPETRIVVDCATGMQTEVDLTPEEEAALIALREAAAEAAANPPPSKQDILLLMLDGMDPEDPDTTVLWLVLQEALRP